VADVDQRYDRSDRRFRMLWVRHIQHRPPGDLHVDEHRTVTVA
jgi:hypothetical protein